MQSDKTDESPVPKPWVDAIAPYVPGKASAPDGKPLIKLSANENPLGTSPAALAARHQSALPSRYPDPDSSALREGIGALHNIEPARIMCGTGSDELLNLAAQSYAGPGDEVMFSRYSFSVYEIAALRCGATPVEIADDDFGADIDAILAAQTDKTRVVFIANPNNPTGSYLDAAALERLHSGLRGDVLLVVDQAYAEYLDPGSDDGAMALAKQYNNVLVTRTFSKIYGLAGARVGWATGDREIIDNLSRIRGPFNVTSEAQVMALAALSDQDFIATSRIHNMRERDRFIGAITRLGNAGLRALPSEANFVLVVFSGRLGASAANTALIDAGYAVRAYGSSAGALSNALRITIGKKEQMDEITAIITELAEGAHPS